jgi:hypothetical protein
VVPQKSFKPVFIGFPFEIFKPFMNVLQGTLILERVKFLLPCSNYEKNGKLSTVIFFLSLCRSDVTDANKSCICEKPLQLHPFKTKVNYAGIVFVESTVFHVKIGDTEDPAGKQEVVKTF